MNTTLTTIAPALPAPGDAATGADAGASATQPDFCAWLASAAPPAVAGDGALAGASGPGAEDVATDDEQSDVAAGDADTLMAALLLCLRAAASPAARTQARAEAPPATADAPALPTSSAMATATAAAEMAASANGEALQMPHTAVANPTAEALPQLSGTPAAPDLLTANPLSAAPSAASVATPTPTAPATAASTLPPSWTLHAESPDWSMQLGEVIRWSAEAQREAVVELHPAELGQLTVRVELHGNDADVTIAAESAAARSLIEQTLPQLRELFAAQGLGLQRARVGATERSTVSAAGRAAGDDTAEASSAPGPRRQLRSLLLVDAYA